MGRVKLSEHFTKEFIEVFKYALEIFNGTVDKFIGLDEKNDGEKKN